MSQYQNHLSSILILLWYFHSHSRHQLDLPLLSVVRGMRNGRLSPPNTLHLYKAMFGLHIRSTLNMCRSLIFRVGTVTCRGLSLCPSHISGHSGTLRQLIDSIAPNLSGTMKVHRHSSPKLTVPTDAPPEQTFEEIEVVLDQEAAPATTTSFSPDETIVPPLPTAGDDFRNFQELFKRIADTPQIP